MEFADYWGWLTAGVVLMVLEILTPGVFFMWIGFGALLTGLVSALFPEASAALLGTVFAVLSVISVLVGRKLIGKKQAVENSLNNRGALYVGQSFQVFEPIADGRGKIKVGDTLWLASCPQNIPVGATVKVTGVNGTFLVVEPVNEQ